MIEIQEGLNKGKKFGVWIMPDNEMVGMLETFLAYLIPTEKQSLWTYTETVVKEAKIHTWLAWQNPPGRQLHQAIKQTILTLIIPNLKYLSTG